MKVKRTEKTILKILSVALALMTVIVGLPITVNGVAANSFFEPKGATLAKSENSIIYFDAEHEGDLLEPYIQIDDGAKKSMKRFGESDIYYYDAGSINNDHSYNISLSSNVIYFYDIDDQSAETDNSWSKGTEMWATFTTISGGTQKQIKKQPVLINSETSLYAIYYSTAETYASDFTLESSGGGKLEGTLDLSYATARYQLNNIDKSLVLLNDAQYTSETPINRELLSKKATISESNPQALVSYNDTDKKYEATSVTPLSIEEVDIINVSTNEEAISCFLGQTYKFSAKVTGGIEKLQSTAIYSLHSSEGTWAPTTIGDKLCKITVSNGVDRIEYNFQDLTVYEPISYPSVVLNAEGVKYGEYHLLYGKNTDFTLNASVVGDLKYLGKIITDYNFVFRLNNEYKDSPNPTTSFNITGNEALRGEKECDVRISFISGNEEIVSEPLDVLNVEFLVPQLDTPISANYINSPKTETITAIDFDQVYYRVFNENEEITTDTSLYAVANMSNNKFNVNITTADNKDKTLSIIGKYGDKIYHKELKYLVDTINPEVSLVTVKPVGLANLTFLNFGIFANDKISFEAEVIDEKSGIKSVMLYKDAYTGGSNSVEVLDCQSYIERIDKEAVATFILNAPLEENIYLEVVDNADNKTLWEVTEVSDGVNLIEVKNYVVIENEVPSIELTPTNVPDLSSNGNTFTNNATINVKLTDNLSGLSDYVVKINGNIVSQKSNISKDENSIVKTRTFSVSTENIPKSQNGEYSVFVEVVDNAGNIARSDTTKVYLDVTKPTITGYEIRSLGDAEFTAKDNLFPFGVIFSNDIELVITAVDKRNSVGIREIILSETNNVKFVNSDSRILNNGDTQYTATYRISMPFSGTLLGCVIDNAGNQSTNVLPTGAPIILTHNGQISDEFTYPANGDYSNFIFDITSNCRARYTITPNVEPIYIDGVKRWYNDHIDVTAVAAEYANKGSVGIRDTKLEINDVQVGIKGKQEIINGVVSSVTYKVNTIQAANSEKDGKYVFKGTVTDNAGNESQTTSTFYIDRKAPEITGFKFTPNNSVDGTTANLIETDKYGYYFKADTTVIISAGELSANTDEASGVKSIYYEIVPVEGNKKSETVLGDEAIFTVPADFKGQIYAYAVDFAENQSETVHPEGLIVESETLHKTTSSISLSAPSTDKKDTSGNKLYDKDIDVKLVVSDKYSGIASVSYSVQSNYDTSKNVSSTVTVNDGSLSDSSWTVTKTDINLVTEMTKTLKVSNNSNGIVVKVTLTDNAGNKSEKSIRFSIDKTDPVINLSYNGSGEYSNTSRTLTITVKERNLSLGNIDSYIEKNITATNGGKVPKLEWTLRSDSSNPDNNTFTGKAVFSADGKYKAGIKVTDMAGNSASKSNNTQFTIDKTAPRISFSQVSEYNSTARTITVTVVEANFNPEAASAGISVTAHTGSAPRFGGWTSSGSTHTASATFGTDGQYSITMNYTDRAGNRAQAATISRFTIDANAPKITVNGIENKKAYTEDVISFTVDVTDLNLEKIDITLNALLRKDASFIKKIPYTTTTPITNGTRYTWSNIPAGSDGIYTLTCSATDKAGNTTTVLRESEANNDDTSKLVFSVNRDGSNYELASQTSMIMGSWVSSSHELVFSEVNANPIKEDSIIVKLTNKSTEEEIILKKGVDFDVEVKAGEGQWYEYIYTIKPESFSADGYYDIEVTSVDSADRTTSSKNHANGATLIAYGIDSRGANVDISGINNGPYDSVQRDAVITVTDISLTKVVVKLNGEIVDEWEAEIEGESYNGTVTVRESGGAQVVSVEATDAAGNSVTKEQEVFVSSNGFSIFMYRATSFFASYGLWVALGLVVIAVATAAYIIVKRNKKSKSKPKK